MAGDQLIYGLHAVQAALQRDAEHVTVILLDASRKDARMQAIVDAAAKHHVEIQRVARKELDALAPEARHQGVVARCRVRAAWKEDDLERILDGLTEPPFLLVLDGVQDPHNLGACLRTADAAGVHAVIAPRDRAVGLTPVVRKVASGAAEAVPFIQVTNLARTLRMLQERGVWTVGADAATDKDLFDADLRGPLALIMGAEGQGMRRLTREHCDVLIRIPMRGAVESLNVSVATGICLFEALRRRT
ncbi:MAG: 23S rRNA (guanosine(2251)-2'-O)-methyltransferase RlmB [Gammaproteobacteria bacterium]|nr:23S rRNA (guanosine(2251)-2'-O)-methyltransferase RlmB [Gammaproteobacteria bacterium]